MRAYRSPFSREELALDNAVWGIQTQKFALSGAVSVYYHLHCGAGTNGPQENFGSLRLAAACRGMPRHAAACFNVLVKGTIIF